MAMRIAQWIRGHRCERLVKRTATEITISGTSVEAGPATLNIPSVSTKIKEIVKATELATALDDNQYLLCTTASSLTGALRDDVNRIRIVTIQQITYLRALLASLDQEEEVRKELMDWIKITNRLQRDIIKSFTLGLRPKGKTRTSMRQIMKYQGIEETDLDNALKII